MKYLTGILACLAVTGWGMFLLQGNNPVMSTPVVSASNCAPSGGVAKVKPAAGTPSQPTQTQVAKYSPAELTRHRETGGPADKGRIKASQTPSAYQARTHTPGPRAAAREAAVRPSYAGDTAPEPIVQPIRIVRVYANGREQPGGPTGHVPKGGAARAALARDIQKELKRVGCWVGRVDGDWGETTRSAMRHFLRGINASLPHNEPDVILLSLVRNHTGSSCGLGTHQTARVPIDAGTAETVAPVATARNTGWTVIGTNRAALPRAAPPAGRVAGTAVSSAFVPTVARLIRPPVLLREKRMALGMPLPRPGGGTAVAPAALRPYGSATAPGRAGPVTDPALATRIIAPVPRPAARRTPQETRASRPSYRQSRYRQRRSSWRERAWKPVD
ncbi:MAG TPA: peptidoglycan-binding domain-containing protein [Hyphomicrobiaceae bacterium]|nr:peptidoglycan-binding domain-containing protein [Hyphomicrobiaceae bacterium]